MSLFQHLVTQIDGKKICLGVDPHLKLLSSWGLRGTIIEQLEQFSSTVLSTYTPEYVSAIKPQSAFFEQFGSQGIATLEQLLEQARAKKVPVILDVKRGDIGSTMAGYANAYLSDTSSLRVDAITVSPYLGPDSLTEVAQFATEYKRGIFVLCLTSNSEAKPIQQAQTANGQSVAKQVFDWAFNFNAKYGTTVGLVVGATIGNLPEQAGVNLSEFNGPILAPGVGVQGAQRAELEQVFKSSRQQVLPSISRAVLQAGPDMDAMRQMVQQMFTELSND